MKNRSLPILATLLAMAFAMSATRASAQPTGLQEIKEAPITLQVNQERIISISIIRATTGNDGIVRVTPLSDNSGVLLSAVGPGRTEVRLFPADQPQSVRVYEITVKRRDLRDVKKEIDALLAYMVGVQVDVTEENLILKGDVLEPQDRSRLDRIIELYPELIDFTVNKYQQVEEERLRDIIIRDLEDEKLTTIRVEIKNVRGQFKALLRGVAYTDRARARAEEIAKLYYEDVVNLIQLEKPVIEIDVILSTLSLDKVKQLGTNDVWSQATNFVLSGYLDSNFGRSSFYDDDQDNIGQMPGDARPDEPGLSRAPVIQIAPGGVTSFLRALSRTDASIFYSEQHQAVLSGQDAEFKDGGTLIFPSVTAESTGVTEIEFGLEVKVTPEQKENGTILNTIDVSNSTPVALDATTGGASVALAEFQTSSVVECRSDETIVLSGIDSQQLTHSDQGTPYLRRIPVINLLFRARDKQGTESRSLILITPTSSTIRREDRRAFSVDSFQKRDFMRNEAPWWERKIDWGYYNEFYRRPERQIPILRSYETELFWSATQQALAESSPEMMSDDPMMGDDMMGEDMMGDEMMMEGEE